jgi:arylsulfatase
MQHPHPNLLFIFSDQQHWQALGCEDPFFQTPNLDAFAADSIFFERSFCSTPQCSPSRSSLLTGFYPSHTGVMGNVGNAGGQPLRIRSIGAELQEAGYHTGYFGKWHLGSDPVATAGWDEELRKIDDPLATEMAVRFLENRSSDHKPFALFVSINDPHDIYRFAKHAPGQDLSGVPLPGDWEKETFEGKPAVQRQYMEEDQGAEINGAAREEWQRYHDCYREKNRLFDAAAGRILNALDRCGDRENTAIVITSDHGDMDTHHRLIFKGPFLYEQMVRVPLMVQLPVSFDVTPRRIKDVDVVNVDLVPSIREICGLPPRESHGRSLLPLLTGHGPYDLRKFVVTQYYSKQKWVNPIRMIRTPNYKLNRHLHRGDELYDLTKDPDELVNLADQPASAEVIADLRDKLDQWMLDHEDPFYSQPITDREGNLLLNPAVKTPIGDLSGGGVLPIRTNPNHPTQN